MTLASEKERLRFAAMITSREGIDPAVAHTVPLVGWRWFLEGEHIVFEPPGANSVELRDMYYLDRHLNTTAIGVVYRSMPRPGVYLRCKLMESGTVTK